MYRLTHSVSELAGFTCTNSLTKNEKFQHRARLCRVRYRKFRVQCVAVTVTVIFISVITVMAKQA